LYLGNLSRDSGDVQAALRYYDAAATEQGTIGQEAAKQAEALRAR
jgi:hypothetical protein